MSRLARPSRPSASISPTTRSAISPRSTAIPTPPALSSSRARPTPTTASIGLTSLTYTHGTSTLASYALTYDANSQVTKVVNSDGTSNYTYDSVGQLTGAAYSNSAIPTESYTYDANGNRLTSGTTVSYEIGANNQLLSDGTYEYQYDNDGNLVLRTSIADGSTESYTYDARTASSRSSTRTQPASRPSGSTYTYDALNRRISESVAGRSGTVVTVTSTMAKTSSWSSRGMADRRRLPSPSTTCSARPSTRSWPRTTARARSPGCSPTISARSVTSSTTAGTRSDHSCTTRSATSCHRRTRPRHLATSSPAASSTPRQALYFNRAPILRAGPRPIHERRPSGPQPRAV